MQMQMGIKGAIFSFCKHNSPAHLSLQTEKAGLMHIMM